MMRLNWKFQGNPHSITTVGYTCLNQENKICSDSGQRRFQIISFFNSIKCECYVRIKSKEFYYLLILKHAHWKWKCGSKTSLCSKNFTFQSSNHIVLGSLPTIVSGQRDPCNIFRFRNDILCRYSEDTTVSWDPKWISTDLPRRQVGITPTKATHGYVSRKLEDNNSIYRRSNISWTCDNWITS